MFTNLAVNYVKAGSVLRWVINLVSVGKFRKEFCRKVLAAAERAVINQLKQKNDWPCGLSIYESPFFSFTVDMTLDVAFLMTQR